MGELPPPASHSEPGDPLVNRIERARFAVEVRRQLATVDDRNVTAVYTTRVEGIVIETSCHAGAWRTTLWPVDSPGEAVPYEEGTHLAGPAHADAVAYVQESLGMTVRRPR